MTLPPMVAVLTALGVKLHGEGPQPIRCPVHEDRSASAHLYADDRVYCFKCGRGWNALSLVMAKLKLDRPSAEQWLRLRFSGVDASAVDLVRTALRKAPASTARLEAQLDLLDQRVRQTAPDAQTAVRWWMAIDFVRAEAKSGEAGASKVAKLASMVKA